VVSVTSKEHNNSASPLYGLVLAGGKSIRMGHDKGIIHWHGQEQRYYAADLLLQLCTDVFISCRPEQQNEIVPAYKTLPDNYTGSGPIVGILSAFKMKPNVAWLVIACDLPLIDIETLQFLIQHRDPYAIATTFESPYDGLPEPLITIWEPSADSVLQSHLSENFTCPRKALIRNKEKVNILKAPNPDALINANTPDDARKVKELLSGGD